MGRGRAGVIGEAQEVVRAGVVKLRQLDQRPHGDLPLAFFIPAVYDRIHPQNSGYFLLFQIFVVSDVCKPSEVHVITQVTLPFGRLPLAKTNYTVNS